jgi:hypothetical protein
MPKKFDKEYPLHFYESDQETYNKLVALAQKNRRSLNAEMLVALSEYADQHEDELEQD